MIPTVYIVIRSGSRRFPVWIIKYEEQDSRAWMRRSRPRTRSSTRCPPSLWLSWPSQPSWPTSFSERPKRISHRPGREAGSSLQFSDKGRAVRRIQRNDGARSPGTPLEFHSAFCWFLLCWASILLAAWLPLETALLSHMWALSASFSTPTPSM